MNTIDQQNHSVVSLQSCEKLLQKLERVRLRFAQEFEHQLNGFEPVLQLALNEAESLAFQTPFPHLFFPTLAQEKAEAVAKWAARQQRLNSRQLVAA